MIGKDKVICVITARAGSKEIPGKNYKELCGTPLINYSISNAVGSKYVDAVIISSNCQNVRNVTQHLVDNVKVFFVPRPEELARAESKNESALIHAAYWSEHTIKVRPDIIVNMQPTSPMRRASLIDECLESMTVENKDSLLTVAKQTPFIWKIIDNKAKAFYDYENRPMRQDVPDEDWIYHDNGNLYMVRRDVLLDRLCRIGKNPALFELSDIESYQIDTELDFNVLENIMRLESSN
tara:strand:- start:330 stop:1043 length:714 start_codon:yes stop_codon:yes gene_type:complete